MVQDRGSAGVGGSGYGEGVFEGVDQHAEDVAAGDVAAVGPFEGDAFREADPAADDEADDGAAVLEADALEDLVDHRAAGFFDDGAGFGVGADAAAEEMAIGLRILLDVLDGES